MANVRLVSGLPAAVAQSFNVTNYTALGNTRISFTTTEGNVQRTFNAGGTLSNGFVFISANTIATTATTVSTRKNLATTGNIIVSITASTTGIFEDTSNTDTVTSGDEWYYISVTPNTSGSLTFTSISTIFSATSNTYTVYSTIIGAGVGISNALTRYIPFNNLLTTDNESVSSSANQDYMTAGTLKHGFINVLTNTITATSTIITFKNSASTGNITMSVTADATGIFEDTSNTDTVADGDDWNWRIITGTDAGGVLTFTVISIAFETTTNQFMLMGYSRSTNHTNNATSFFAPAGQQAVVSTEANVGLTSRLANAVAKELEIEVTANPYTLSTTVTFRQNATTDSLTISIAGAATGFFSTTGSTTIAATDEINYKVITPNEAGTFQTQQFSSLIDCTAAGAATVTLKAQIPMVIG